MSSPQPDTAFLLAQQLLGRIVARLVDAGDPPGIALISDGDAAPSYDCCLGLAWVRVAEIAATDGSGTPIREIKNVPTPTFGHLITLEAGILRCAPVVDEQGNAPPPAAWTASALQSASDRQQLRMAILCDFPEDVAGVQADGQLPAPWIPIDAGGCAGGYMTVGVGTSMVI